MRSAGAIVVWRIRDSEKFSLSFRDNAEAAVQYLNYLEAKYPDERGNALLLVGVSDPAEAEKVLSQTHPLYMSRVIAPEFWMPPDA